MTLSPSVPRFSASAASRASRSSASVTPKLAFAASRAADGLEHQVHRRAALDRQHAWW